MKLAVKTLSGFSLIEFLIYFLSLTVLVMIVMSWMMQLHARMVSQEKECSAHMALCAAYDCLVRDVRQAPCPKNAWLKNTPNAYIWCIRDHALGWERTKQGVLIRSEGSYSEATDTWAHRSKSVVMEHCDRLKIALKEQQETKTFFVTAMLDGHVGSQLRTISRTVRLYSGASV